MAAVVAVFIGAILSAILALQGWMLSRIFSLEKKVVFILANCSRCKNSQADDTDHITIKHT